MRVLPIFFVLRLSLPRNLKLIHLFLVQATGQFWKTVSPQTREKLFFDSTERLYLIKLKYYWSSFCLSTIGKRFL